MSNLIKVTTFSVPSNVNTGVPIDGKVAAALIINVNNILSVQTRATPYLTTGVTNLVISYPINESVTQMTLVCTETADAILALANAALISA